MSVSISLGCCELVELIDSLLCGNEVGLELGHLLILLADGVLELSGTLDASLQFVFAGGELISFLLEIVLQLVDGGVEARDLDVVGGELGLLCLVGGLELRDNVVSCFGCIAGRLKLGGSADRRSTCWDLVFSSVCRVAFSVFALWRAM